MIALTRANLRSADLDLILAKHGEICDELRRCEPTDARRPFLKMQAAELETEVARRNARAAS